MKRVACHFLIAGSVALCYLVASSPAIGQISSDGTLTTNVSQSGNVLEITGGAQAGGNLFHSFKDFSLPTDNTAFFNNAANIANIISRVTGGNISNIDGLIRANGGANLILINPSGINFGPNARLNIGGSFLGSTASSLKFADGTEFSATNPQATPRLTISVPLGLQFGQNPSGIRVQGRGHSLTVADPIFSPVARGSSLTGLSVQPGQSIALVGGDITLEGGTLTAERGRIELGSVAEGLVRLNPTSIGWTLGYEDVLLFRDVELRSRALADASGTPLIPPYERGDDTGAAFIPGGSIQVQGRRLSVRDGSLILIQNQGFQSAGSIFVNASDAVEVSGTNADGTIRSSLTNETVGAGKGGDVAVSTRQLVVQDGGTIVAKTFSPATGGDLNLNASESTQVIGASTLNPRVTSSIVAATFGAGDSGNNTLSTGRLTAIGGGTVATATFGTGKGGNLSVNATDSIELLGVEPNLFAPSGLLASAFNAGNAGNLTINTSRLAVRDGGRVDASTFATGSGGNVTINASESVEVKGTVSGSINPSLVISSANLVDQSLQQTFNLPRVPSGKSGDVTINTGQLRLSDGAFISVRNDGSGDAGTITVKASSMFVTNSSGITAATTFGGGGNITLEAQELEWRRGSEITAIAGGIGNGGNINVDAQTLVVLEDSNITADAVQGNGGNIQVGVEGLFVCPDCGITASSQLGVDGVVKINTPDLENNLEFLELPQEVINPEQVVALSCAANRRQASSKFTITGRSGLPPRPSEPLSTEALVSIDPPSPSAENPSGSTITKEEADTSELPPPAQSWYVNAEGVVVLTAQATTANPYNFGSNPPDCHAN